MPNLGLAIRMIREARQRSLSDVSAKAGVGVPFLSLLERNERNATPETLARIARALDIPADVLLLQAGLIDSPHGAEGVAELDKALDKVAKAEAALRRKLGVDDAAA